MSPAVSPSEGVPALPPRPPSRPLSGEKAELVAHAKAEAAELRGLRLLRPVEAREGGPELVQWLVERAIAEAKTNGRFEEERLMLEAFRFVPPNYDLEGAVKALLGEQARGVYDHRDGTLLLVDAPAGLDAKATAELEATGVNPLELYLIHELTHALEDQHFDLSRLMDGGPDLTEDTSQAYRALAEGDATFVMYDWLFQKTLERHVYEMEDLERLRDAMRSATEGPESERLRAAPLYLRETLLFAYSDGLLFVHALYRDGGWERVNDAFRKPPETTEQIMHPEKYLAGEGARVVAAPDSTALRDAGWSRQGEGRLGELGLSLFVRNLAGARPVPPGIGRGWGGDHYTLWRGPAGEVGALWRIVFDDRAARDRFLDLAGPILRASGQVVVTAEGEAGLMLAVGLPRLP